MTETPREISGDRRDPSCHSDTIRAGQSPIHEDISPTTGVLLATALFASFQGLLIAHGQPALFDGGLWDPDSYMWLERARHLREHGGWFDHVYPRIDPPAGFVSHWTRPTDAMLLAGSWALAPLLGFDRALFWWSAATGPLLFVAAAVAAIWGARPLVPRQALWLPPLILTTQPAILASFAVGRPDHQGLLALLFALMLGGALRMALAPRRIGPTIATSLFAAVALWISVQILPLIAAFLAGLTISWILRRQDLARSLVLFFAVLCVALAAALLVEYGPEAFAPRASDTLSPSHLAVFSALLAFWFGAATLSGLGTGARLLYAFLAASGLGVVLWFLTPDLFAEPIGPIDPLYQAVHLNRIRELQPAFVPRAGVPWLEQITPLIMRLGIAIPAAVYLGFRIFASRGRSRDAWGILAIVAVVYVTLSLVQLRWANFAVLSVLIPYVGLVSVVMVTVTRVARRYRLHPLARPAVIAFACLWTFIPALSSQSQDVIPGAKATRPQCPVREAARILADPRGLGARSATILAYPDYGPVLLYRTPHSVLSIPNHRPQPGFTLTHRIMSERDPETALALMRERGIDFVLICTGSAEAAVYRPSAPRSSLYQKLAAGTPPRGLAPIPMPEDRVGGFRLFRVEPDDG